MCLNWILRWKSCSPFLLLHCISTSTNLSFMLSMTALWYDSHRGVIAQKSSTSSLVHQNVYSLCVDVIVFRMMCVIFNLISCIQTVYLLHAEVEVCRILGLSLNLIIYPLRFVYRLLECGNRGVFPFESEPYNIWCLKLCVWNNRVFHYFNLINIQIPQC